MSNSPQLFSRALQSALPFSPTSDQEKLFARLETFMQAPDHSRSVFLLKGYAGTGKTTAVSALVKVLPQFGYQTMLLAPTGRAAKVMAQYSGQPAYTIHKKIYWQTSNPYSEGLSFERQRNKQGKTVFIVDEASMISDDKAFGENGLLQDLIEYVFEKGSNRLLLVGDTAQLPPVGQPLSPSLDADYLRHTLGCDVTETELKQVMRQGQESGILLNATRLREELPKEELKPAFNTKPYRDIYRMTSERLEDGLRYAYDKYGMEETIVICRSNKNANLYNQHIRRQIVASEEEIGVGDLLMVVKNNYFWLPKDSGMGFLANGDFAEITKIITYEELYGFRFATVRLRLIDYPDAQELEAKIILDTLHSPTPALSQEENSRLYQEVMKDYADLKTKKERSEAMKANPHLNALQVKFAYALTCHKAQGGQWKAVFVDHGFLKDEPVNKELVRWLYTAVTRSTNELFLVNFAPQFVEG